jgi:TRAP-type C4-dicarboxylate transport system permease large subunit
VHDGSVVYTPRTTVRLGFDPIWLGIIITVWLETTPYFFLMILLVALLFLVPDLALWLPRHMMGR